MVKQFILKACMIGLLSLLLVTSISISIQPDPEDYYFVSLEKTRLLQDTPSPRIIIFGGSNVAFGIDSALIEDEFGVPVINDGLHALLGIIPLNEIREYVHPGDIIIVSIETHIFTGTGLYGWPSALSQWIEISPNRIRYLHNPLSEMPTIYTMMLQRKINRQINFYLNNGSLAGIRGVYLGTGFNEHGDFVGHLDDKAVFEIPADMYPVDASPAAYEELEDFHQFALTKGARVFYEAPAHRQTNCDMTGMKAIRKFYETLMENTTIPLLTDTEQLCFPDDYFYNTNYHLNARGRKIRTERLIENLAKALGAR